MKNLAELLRANADSYREKVHQEFFLDHPEARQIFSLSMKSTHLELAGGLAWFLERCDHWGTPSPAALERVRRLGVDHRRHGFPPETYAQFATYLIRGLDLFDLSPSDRVSAEKAVGMASAAMREAATEADKAGVAPAHQARVIEVDHPNRETATIRLETAMPLAYHPGQYFSVTTSLIQGRWVHLAAAAPPNLAGQLEFHVQASASGEMEAAGVLKRAKLGDSWTFGEPRGTFPRAAADVFLCFGTGWAMVRSHLVGLVDATAGQPKWTSAVYAHALSPGQHYDAATQDNLSRLGLSLTRLVGSNTDPWLLGAKGQAPSCTVTDNPVATVIEREGTGKRFVLVGPAAQVDKAAAQLKAAGATDVETHPWATGRAWNH
ncbi:FAD-binding oxidoreductase [Corynebacterium phocae]|uniref:FAD-binding oxidoreductase n=1 Tax=Corynebacterium phocae TaxID=161895 RepID=UPI0009529A48|nr:FAD-binding oxidoreductase [Corynebacterium phocae]KAA8721672.1 2-polyprenylphenol hydroxylase [Corynebacterium phocae]